MAETKKPKDTKDVTLLPGASVTVVAPKAKAAPKATPKAKAVPKPKPKAKAPKKKAKAKVKAPKVKAPSYQQLLDARRAMDEAHSEVRIAERLLRSAQSINTAAHREVAVADARARLNEARQAAADASDAFQTMKYQGRSR